MTRRNVPIRNMLLFYRENKISYGINVENRQILENREKYYNIKILWRRMGRDRIWQKIKQNKLEK